MRAPEIARVGARVAAILLQRCPVCLRGRVFRSLLGMHKECPQCGLSFAREHGYFLNSMFIAYAAGFLLLAPSAVLMGLRNLHVVTFTVVLVAETLLIWPLIFRSSRILWMHVDQMLDPRPPPAAPAAPAAQEEEPTHDD